jgi:hypothetical protein
MITGVAHSHSTSTIRMTGSGSLRSAPISGSKRKITRGAQRGLGQDPMDCEPTHTITCHCCGTTTQVPIRRRFLCDTCFHDGPD